MENNEKKVRIDLNIKPTKDFGQKLVITLFEYLLHSRSQIPFHFDLFKKFIETKTRLDGDVTLRKPDWKTEKQLKLAVETYEKACLLKEIIQSKFVPGVPMMILFGSTIHTVKESYRISLPPVNNTSLPTIINETSTIKQILLNIIETDELKPSDKHLLPTTNIFILFGRSDSIGGHPEMNELRNFKLSKSCKKFVIQFRDSTDFNIFEEDFQGLNLNNKVCEVDNVTPIEIWFQPKTFVKGFKDVLVNNKSIWN